MSTKDLSRFRNNDLKKILKKRGFDTTKLTTKTKVINAINRNFYVDVVPKWSRGQSTLKKTFGSGFATARQRKYNKVSAYSLKCKRSVTLTRPKIREYTTKSGSRSIIGCQRTKRCGIVCSIFGHRQNPKNYQRNLATWLR